MARTARTEGERRILEGAPAGRLIDLDDLADEERVVSADLIRRVCIGQDSAQIDPRGLRVKRARIEEELDLSFSILPFPVGFEDTTFISTPDLTGARLPGLWITLCSLPGMTCEGMRVNGDLRLEQSTLEGEVALRGAQIDGILWCEGTKVTNREGSAIVADLVEINGGVFLRNLSAEGEVRFPEAKVRGDFDCTEAVFTSEHKDALTIDGAEIGGNLVLEKVNAIGAIRFPGARIGGSVSFAGATVSNEGSSYETGGGGFADKTAINATRAEIASGFMLGIELTANGAVQLSGARIGGDLYSRLVSLNNKNGYALSAEGADIGGTVDLRGSSATGEVRLVGTKIGGDLNCYSTKLANNRYADSPEIEEFALEAREVAIGGSLIFHGLREVSGGVDLYQASSATLVDDLGRDDDHPLGSWDGIRPLVLDGFAYARFGKGTHWTPKLRTRWLKATTRFEHTAWQQLIRVYRAYGLDDDAARAAIAMQNDRVARAGLPRYRRAGRRILWAVVGHGYRPWLAGVWAAAVIATFALLIWRFPSMFLAQKGAHGPPQPIAYAADTFLPIVDLGQKDGWQPTGWMRWFDWTVILLGWALSTIFIAGFTRIVRTE
jgi:hypothetical protein